MSNGQDEAANGIGSTYWFSVSGSGILSRIIENQMDKKVQHEAGTGDRSGLLELGVSKN